MAIKKPPPSFIPTDSDLSSVEAFQNAVSQAMGVNVYADDEDEWFNAWEDAYNLAYPKNLIKITGVVGAFSVIDDLHYQIINEFSPLTSERTQQIIRRLFS